MQKGITLVELLVALSIFLIILGGVTRIFVAHFKSQRIILAEQLLLDQANYTVEYMSRALRMAKKELNCTDPRDIETCSEENNPYCLAKFGDNYEITQTGYGIKFLNPMRGYACQEFYLNGGMLKEEIIKSPPSGTPIAAMPLLSERIQVNSLSFEVDGDEPGDFEQPKVTIRMELEIPEENLKINIQNTVSQRDLDVTLLGERPACDICYTYNGSTNNFYLNHKVHQDTDTNYSWVAALGYYTDAYGVQWGPYARIVGVNNCSNQYYYNTGYTDASLSFRIIVRP